MLGQVIVLQCCCYVSLARAYTYARAFITGTDTASIDAFKIY